MTASAVAARTISKITVATISTQRVGVAFTIHGTFQVTAGLTFTDDKGTTAVPLQETFSFSFGHPGYQAQGSQTVTVSVPGGVSAKSNAFRIVKA